MVQSRGRLRRSQSKIDKSHYISLTAKIAGDALVWIKKRPPRSTFKRLFLETKTLLIPIMSTGSAKSPAEGLKNSECERGVITTRPPIPYVAAVDPYYKKAEKTEIKTRQWKHKEPGGGA